MTLISLFPLRRLACSSAARLRNALSGLPRTPADAVRRLTDRWIESIPEDPTGEPENVPAWAVGADDYLPIWFAETLAKPELRLPPPDDTLDLSPDEYRSMFARVNTQLPTTRQSV